MKNQLLAIAVLCSTVLHAQPPACTSVTSNGNLQANEVFCPQVNYGAVNMGQVSTMVITGTRTISNINNFNNADIWVYGTLTTGALNLNGKARLHIMPGGKLISNSSELQNGNNGVDMQGGEWVINGDLQLTELTSSITQCDSKVTITANLNAAGGVGKYSLCECAMLDIKGVLNMNRPNMFTGMGFIKAKQANMNNALTQSSGISACLPTSNNLGAAMASCLNGCSVLNLPYLSDRPAANQDERVWFDGVYVHAPKDWISVAVFDNVGRKLEGGAISGTYKVKADKGFYVVVLTRKHGQQKTLKIIK